MNTTLNQNRSLNLFIVAGFAITVVTILILAIVPSIVPPQSASVPLTEGQNAYVEYLRGEKVMYTNPVELDNALAAYHLGEKVIAGSDLGSAMLEYRSGEKEIYAPNSDISDALWLYHLGEKEIVNTAESALILHHLGEKGIK